MERIPVEPGAQRLDAPNRKGANVLKPDAECTYSGFAPYFWVLDRGGKVKKEKSTILRILKAGLPVESRSMQVSMSFPYRGQG